MDDMNDIASRTRKPSLKHLLVLAKDDWWMITLGTLSFCFIGLELSTLYILMSESLKVGHVSPCIYGIQSRYLKFMRLKL